MSFLACEETNGADFALTMSPDKSTASKSVPARSAEKTKTLGNYSTLFSAPSMSIVFILRPIIKLTARANSSVMAQE